MAINYFYGSYRPKQQGKHAEIWFKREHEVTKLWGRMGEKMRSWWDEQNPVLNQSGFWLYQHCYKRFSLYSTAKKCFEEGRITFERYKYLTTPVLPE